MSDVQHYIDQRTQRDQAFAQNFETGYTEFKIGVILRQAREEAGLTQEEVAQRLHTKKSAISRIENHADTHLPCGSARVRCSAPVTFGYPPCDVTRRRSG